MNRAICLCTKELGQFSSEIVCTFRTVEGETIKTVDFIEHGRPFGVLVSVLEISYKKKQALVRAQSFQESETFIVAFSDLRPEYE